MLLEVCAISNLSVLLGGINMEDNKCWLYFSLEELIDLEIDHTDQGEESIHDRANIITSSNGAPKPSTEHTE